MKVLLTGGAGYIGSITAAALTDAGHVPVILDSLLTEPEAFTRDHIFYRGDIADRELVAESSLITRISSARSHGGSSGGSGIGGRPHLYYRDNVAKSLELF